MTSIRSMRRNAARKTAEGWQGLPQYTEFHGEEGDISGYTTLHPTKGWRTVSTKRLRAQARMAQMLA